MSINIKKINLHLTNVTGLGATKLLLSLLPYLEKNSKFNSHKLFVPENGPLSEYVPINSNTKVTIFSRKLPNLLSRFLECLLPNQKYNDGNPILVFGDIPLRISKGKQVVFLQSPLLVTPWLKVNQISDLKYFIAKLVFYFNLPYVNTIVVQTSIMKEKLIRLFPTLTGRVVVLSQPVPDWIKKKK